MEETKVYLIVQDVPSSTKTLARVFSSPEKAQEVIDSRDARTGERIYPNSRVVERVVE